MTGPVSAWGARRLPVPNRLPSLPGAVCPVGMSRTAQVIVLARYEDEVMEPLTRPDEARTWQGCFVQLPWLVGGWHIEFEKSHRRRGVLKDLESLPWNEPACVQVMLHDQDDDLFGLWMFRDGVLVEVGFRAPSEFTPQRGCGTWTPASWSGPVWAEERAGTRRSTCRTRGCLGDPAQAGAGYLLKAPLAGPARAGPVSSGSGLRPAWDWRSPNRSARSVGLPKSLGHGGRTGPTSSLLQTPTSTRQGP
ncbi:hypothetical protein OV450_3919 [Actinobacteria bacterium OV450]|nr:hypothetical protein OV450_3919 [Actinobacteria bacterium OV450]